MNFKYLAWIWYVAAWCNLLGAVMQDEPSKLVISGCAFLLFGIFLKPDIEKRP